MVWLSFSLLFNTFFYIEAKNVLLSAGHYMNSHTGSLSLLAKRICNDPEFNCTIVSEHGLNSKWQNIKGHTFYLSDSEDSEKFKNLLDFYVNQTEGQKIKGLEVLQEVLEGPLSYWKKDKIYEKLDQIGIDIAICDSLNVGCLIATHLLNIQTTVIYSPLCNSWIFFGIHDPDWNNYPIGSHAGLTEKMTFFQRFTNFYKTILVKTFGAAMYEDIAKKHAPYVLEKDWKDNTLMKREALYILPCIPSYNYAEYLPPNFIHSGPIINRNVFQVNKEILDFLEKFEKIVYVSFGSLSVNYDFKEILKTASMMPGVGFVVSYAGAERVDKNEVPFNCFLVSWLSQTDLLGSGKVDVFVTHAGWNSVCESLLHGVPMIACGWAVDRKDHSVLIHNRKVGRAIIQKEQFKVQYIVDEISEVLGNGIYKENAKKYSNLIKKMDSEGKVVEVIKTYLDVGIGKLVVEGNYSVNWIQAGKFDIYAFVIFIGIFIIYLVSKCLKLVLSKSQQHLRKFKKE